MTPVAVLTFGHEALTLMLMVSGPLLLILLGVGLLISIFQALTQVNEPTLSFVPKLLAAVVVLAVAGPWMLTTLVDYIKRTLLLIPEFVQ